MTTKQLVLATGVFLCVFVLLHSSDSNASESQPNAPIPLPFTKNMGQWPDSILFRASANGATMWFTKNGIWYQFFRSVEKTDASATAIDPTILGGPPTGRVPVNDFPNMWGRPQLAVGSSAGDQPDSIESTMIKAEFVDANESVEVVGLEELEYKCNYFIGNEPDKWRTDVPNYGAVTMRGLYPGVDVTFASHEGRLESKMLSVSSTDLAQVKVEYRGANIITQQSTTSAFVQSPFGEHTFEGILLSDVSAFNSEQPSSSATSSASGLSLVYSTFLGGSEIFNESYGIAVDSAENSYVTGYTTSADFPTQNPYQAVIGGGDFSSDVFVTKFSREGNGLIYSTFLGGSNGGWEKGDTGRAIAVDASGNAYVTGSTDSPDFPTQNPYQASNGGGPSDAFVTVLNSAGNGLIYSTYLGGIDSETGNGIALDAAGNCYVIGTTWSPDFPTQNPFQASKLGFSDAFITKINSTSGGLIYSTYLGGIGGFEDASDAGHGIAVDSAGNAYVTGYTPSFNFPTQNPFQASKRGFSDAFITKINSEGSGLIYSTYLGGDNSEGGSSIAIDAWGNAYITGWTSSVDFPTQNPLQDSNGAANSVVFVTKINSSGNGLVYSTYLGGSHQEIGFGIAVDVADNAYVTGLTYSTNFPTQIPFQGTKGGNWDAFVFKINAVGSALHYSTYLGGGGDDFGYGIAIDTEGGAYVAGTTTSFDFPTQNPFQASLSRIFNAFVTKLISLPPCCTGSRGNANGDAGDAVNVVDVTFLVQYLFQGGASAPCLEEADVAVNNSINIVDLTTLVAFLFSGGPALQACP
jgi:Beta-propeller repeat